VQPEVQDENVVIDSEEPTLRFSIAMLREAGTRLGEIHSTVVPQRVTLEELAQRADKLYQCADKLQRSVVRELTHSSK
jgi:hypothetical protein